tara:strand:- start:84 stop:542 length:459 start_codon:yes stop_codon:yes gene_type:complete
VTYYETSAVPDISTVWGENAAPLSQTREETREDLRRILNIPVSLEGLGNLTRQMNATAELSGSAAAGIEANIGEYKTLETSRTAIQNKASWDGSAPLKKADVVEYDTSLLARPDAIIAQTQGINARMGQLEMEIRVSLGLTPGHGTARLYRS